MKLYQNKFFTVLTNLLILSLLLSCKDFVQVGPPETSISSDLVFNNDNTANAAVAGIYSRMNGSSGGFVSGSNSLTLLCGLYADELTNHSSIKLDQVEFFTNNLSSKNLNLQLIWSELYQYIYTANAVLEGLAKSNEVSENLRKQLTGEALFIRAFCHFYLTNLYGDVPKVSTTDYRVNSKISRSSKNDIYLFIINDLENAKSLLNSSYIDNQKTRVNKAVASAFLSRVYLYHKDWEKAESESTILIQNSDYILEPNVRNVFLKSSRESIWQMQSLTPSFDTFDGFSFILTSSPRNTSLNSTFTLSIPATDSRRINWIGQITVGSTLYYYPYKYKVRLKSIANSPAVEELVVLRLAEQYLIRSEARAHLNKIEEGKEDLNKIRLRANMGNTLANNQSSLLLAIEEERKVEFFAEWAHRWFDLKRTNRADIVLGALKSSWKLGVVDFPLPQLDVQSNPDL